MRRCCGAVAVALLALGMAATAALAHGGGGTDYESEIRTVAPGDAGLVVEVLDRDDRVALHNRGSETVVVEGYDGEPYARIEPDGTVAVNVRSPALYLNEDRFAEVDLPERADGKAAPRWRTVDRSGEFEWHDHRIHWMGADRPPAVRDPERRTKVFDWSVPLRVGGRAGAVDGTLTWVGRPDGGVPVAALVALAVVVLGGIALVVVVRRRRGVAGRGRQGDGEPGEEAW